MKRKIGMAVISLGLIGTVVILLLGARYLTGPSFRVVIPGQTSLSLEEGVYTVYHEYNTAINGVYYGEIDIRGLSLKVTGTEKVPMMPSRSLSTYHKQGRSGKSIFSFEIKYSGEYDIEGSFTEDVVLVINKMSVFNFLMYFAVSAVIFVMSLVIGIYLIVKKT